MKWIKASERLPELTADFTEDNGIVFKNKKQSNCILIFPTVTENIAWLLDGFHGGVNEWEWLDESPSVGDDAAIIDALTKERDRFENDLEVYRQTARLYHSKIDELSIVVKDKQKEVAEIVKERDALQARVQELTAELLTYKQC